MQVAASKSIRLPWGEIRAEVRYAGSFDNLSTVTGTNGQGHDTCLSTPAPNPSLRVVCEAPRANPAAPGIDARVAPNSIACSPTAGGRQHHKPAVPLPLSELNLPRCYHLSQNALERACAELRELP